MFVLDIETTGSRETAIVLSIGIVHVSNDALDTIHTYEDLMNEQIFIKLDSKDQVKRFGRTADKSTVEWWSKQANIVKEYSLSQSNTDVTIEHAMNMCEVWIKSTQTSSDELCFVRGSMDIVVLDHIAWQLKSQPLFEYYRYRDVRTFIDCTYPNSKGGYVEVDTNKCNGFAMHKVLRHHPVHDCCHDLAMMLFGVV